MNIFKVPEKFGTFYFKNLYNRHLKKKKNYICSLTIINK